MMWNSVPFLQSIASWSLVLTLIGGVLAAASGAVGTLASNRAADIEKRESAQLVAQANRRAAVANERAEAARLQIVKMQAGMAWRGLTESQHKILVTELTGTGITVYNTFVGSDPEASQYREMFEAAFSEAGLKTQFYSGWQQAAGVSVLGVAGPDRDVLSSALTKAGIPHFIKPPHQIFGKDHPALLVGTKPERL